MDFLTSHFGKDEPLTRTYLSSLCPPKSEDKYGEKVLEWTEVHLSEMTCYKIHTLVSNCFLLNASILLYIVIYFSSIVCNLRIDFRKNKQFRYL